MKSITIDGVECMTLPDVADLAGITVEALRRRQSRGQVALRPHITIGKQNFYASDEVRAAMRRSLTK
jgi:hypothetical protein